MTIRILFTEAELIALNRCIHCGWSPRQQGHHPECPRERVA